MIYFLNSKNKIRFQQVEYFNIYEYKIARHNMSVRGELRGFDETDSDCSMSAESSGSGTDSSDEQRRQAGWRACLNYR